VVKKQTTACELWEEFSQPTAKYNSGKGSEHDCRAGQHIVAAETTRAKHVADGGVRNANLIAEADCRCAEMLKSFIQCLYTLKEATKGH
jgi:hypothetical protein